MTRVPVYSAGEVGDPLAETPKIILGSEQAAPSSARRGDAREGAVVRSAASCVCDSDYIHIISTAIRDTHTDRSTRPMCVCVSDYIHSNTQHAYRSTRPETWGPGKWRPEKIGVRAGGWLSSGTHALCRLGARAMGVWGGGGAYASWGRPRRHARLWSWGGRRGGLMRRR